MLTGLSDHTTKTTASNAVIRLGSCVIEKNFMLSRADKEPESKFSLESTELERLYTEMREAWKTFGKTGLARQKREENSQFFRQSLYFVKNLPAAHTITAEDIRGIRLEIGLALKYFDNIAGKTLSKSI